MMLSEAILIALIVGGLSLTGTIITNLISSGKMQYRIEQLEKKMDKHNSLVERMITVEQCGKELTRRIEHIEDTLIA